MPDSLDRISRKLRSAVLAGDHVRAGRLAAEYGSALERDWLALPETERAASLLPRQARELLIWVRDMTMIRRALDARQLAIVENALRYQPAGLADPRSSAVQVRI